MMKGLYTLLFIFSGWSVFGQSGIIRGKVLDATNNEPIAYATVQVQGTTEGAVTNDEGDFEIKNIIPGLYNLEVSFVGFASKVVYEIQVTTSRPAFVEIRLKEDVTSLEDVVVTASPFNKTGESPVSLRTIGINEIKRAPGGNRDISKVLRSLPGVASTVSFRNDIIIRGGAPGENKFFIDGIEIPTINHFQTQGSSGGPVGILNVDFLREVDFYSGAFPANRGNALSSVFDFKLKDGREDKVTMNAVLGASDLGVIVEGPLSEKSTFLVSARRSYLQFLFGVIGLPFLPTYNDLQFKFKYKPDSKSQITILGLGAYDDFELNLKANETDFQKYFLANLPVSGQWNYTLGAKYERFRESGYTTMVVSTNTLNSSSFKYFNNDESSPDNLIQDYTAREQEVKIRLENYALQGAWEFNYGVSLERADYTSSNFNKIVTQAGALVIDNKTDIGFNKFAGFGQVNRKFLEGKVVLSMGLRTDANDFSREMINPLHQLSPRASLAYNLDEKLSFNFNTGIYYQLPPYTVLGFTDNVTGELINKSNGIEYIKAKHLVGGLEYNFGFNAISTLEGFYKKYDQYPFLLDDMISLANVGADFGAIGNAPANSSSDGYSYGVEWMYQQKLYKGFYG
ncbi:MAG: TonB-dependent receptor, partial [Cyclobacteriaceae bacterium]|nr:TonB-dependent receptor [Cyclobacteriaceae bacterium]